MSTRKLSEINFEDGVVIAGNRVDKFLDDTVNRFNLLPPVDDKSSWAQQQLLFGYTERRSDFVCGPLHTWPHTSFENRRSCQLQNQASQFQKTQ
jgi:hypothetical protein